MTRGNQREIDRQRAANRHAGKGTAAEGDPERRKERDALALAAKIAKKKADDEAAAAHAAAQAAATSASATKTAAAATDTAAPVPAPPEPAVKKDKKKEDLSFLDSALLPTKKK